MGMMELLILLAELEAENRRLRDELDERDEAGA